MCRRPVRSTREAGPDGYSRPVCQRRRAAESRDGCSAVAPGVRLVDQATHGAGRSPCSTCSRVVRSSTSRRPARTATHRAGRCSATPSYAVSCGRRPRTSASGPPTARNTSPRVMADAGRARTYPPCTAPAEDESPGPQVGDHRLEELARQVLAASQRLDAHRLGDPVTASRRGEREQGPDGVVGVGAEMSTPPSSAPGVPARQHRSAGPPAAAPPREATPADLRPGIPIVTLWINLLLDRSEFRMRRLVLLALVGLGAQLVDGSLGMAYGVTSTTLLLAVGADPRRLGHRAPRRDRHDPRLGCLALEVRERRLGRRATDRAPRRGRRLRRRHPPVEPRHLRRRARDVAAPAHPRRLRARAVHGLGVPARPARTPPGQPLPRPARARRRLRRRHRRRRMGPGGHAGHPRERAARAAQGRRVDRHQRVLRVGRGEPRLPPGPRLRRPRPGPGARRPPRRRARRRAGRGVARPGMCPPACSGRRSAASSSSRTRAPC